MQRYHQRNVKKNYIKKKKSQNSKQNLNNTESEKKYATIGDQTASSTDSCTKRMNKRDKHRSIEYKRMKKEKKLLDQRR